MSDYNKVSMNIYIRAASEVTDNEIYRVYPNKALQFYMSEYTSRIDYDIYELELETQSNIEEFKHTIFVRISFEKGILDINLGEDIISDSTQTLSNMFMNSNDVDNFIEGMEMLYNRDNPNIMNDMIAKINGATMTHVWPNEVKYRNFWRFLNDNDYTWEKFKKELRILTLEKFTKNNNMKIVDKKYIKTFELYKGTYYSAANKLRRKQPKRANKLSAHAMKMGIDEIPFIPKYKMDIYLHFALTDSDEVYPSEIVRDVTFDGHYDRIEDDTMLFDLNVTGPVIYYINIMIILGKTGNVKIIIFDDDNKFANRRSAIALINFLHELYEYTNPNFMSQKMGKITDTTIREVRPEEIEDMNNFWKMLHENGYDWKKFRSGIEINDLWDSYD